MKSIATFIGNVRVEISPETCNVTCSLDSKEKQLNINKIYEKEKPTWRFAVKATIVFIFLAIPIVGFTRCQILKRIKRENARQIQIHCEFDSNPV